MKLSTIQKLFLNSSFRRTTASVSIILCALSIGPIYCYFHFLYSSTAFHQKEVLRVSLEQLLTNGFADFSRFGDYVNARGQILKLARPLGLTDLGICKNGHEVLARFDESRCRSDGLGRTYSVSGPTGKVNLLFYWRNSLDKSSIIFSRSLTYTLCLSIILIGSMMLIMFWLLTYKVRTTSILISSVEDPNELKEIEQKEPELSPMIRSMSTLMENLEQVHREQAQLKTDAAIGSLVAQVAHDLRSPLSALNSILHKRSTESSHESSLIFQVVQRIENIANDLLDRRRRLSFNSYALDKQDPLNTSDVELIPLESVRNAIIQIINEFRFELVDYKITLNFREMLTDGNNIKICTNIHDLQRILSNLLNNSKEAISKDGFISVDVIAGSPSDFLTITIRDSGCGIPAEIIETLGMRAGISYGKIKGNGIGLFHAREKLRSWNGELRINNVSRGASVEILLSSVTEPIIGT